jgi:2-hydroxy-3-oxopropionate reductase
MGDVGLDVSLISTIQGVTFMTESPKIGFIGVGVMGQPMARNLLESGYELVIYDLKKKNLLNLVKLGATPAQSPKEVAKRVEVLILMLPDSPEVEAVMLGEDGVLRETKTDLLVVDMSSITPQTSKQMAQTAADKGVRYIDAPVSGGEKGAINGTLSIMVGGEQEDFEEALPIFKVLGRDVIRVGDVGSGNAVKLANQIMVALNIAAMGEAFVLGVKAGLDPRLLYTAVRGGLAGSNVLEAKAIPVIDGQFEPGFRLSLHIKDLRNVISTGHEIGAPLPLTSLVMEIMQTLRSQGKGDLDHSTIVQFYEQIGDVQINSKRSR